MEYRIENLKKLPKIELHIHIDGSVRPETVSEVLGVSLKDAKQKCCANTNTTSLTEYLKKFHYPLEIMQDEETIERVTKELLEDLMEENVLYVELRYAPMFHTKKGLSMRDSIEAVLKGMRSTKGIQSRLILCCMRHDIENDNRLNYETVRLAKEYLDKGVVALDLAGDESHYPTSLFQELFHVIRKEGVPFTIHAGEADGVESIRSALSMGTHRLGHGVRIIEDMELLKEASELGVTLEVCPDSNVDTFLVSDKKDHPIRELIHHIPVTINTDNRTVSDITLTKEYYDLMTLMNFQIEDFYKCNENALACSFLKKEEKEALLIELRRKYYDCTH